MVKIQSFDVQFDLPDNLSPHPAQIAVVNCILGMIKAGTNALIDSATGSGKSRAIIASIDALHRHEMREGPLSQDKNPLTQEGRRQRKWRQRTPVFILTRTYTQVQQLQRELAQLDRTGTQWNVLAARKHLCVNPQLRNSENLDQKCIQAMRPGSFTRCDWGAGTSHRIKSSADYRGLCAQMPVGSGSVSGSWPDIEDIRNAAEHHRVCPYIASRDLTGQADVQVATFGYVFDQGIRRGRGINIAGAIIMVDESHNLPTFIRDSASASISSPDLRLWRLQLAAMTPADRNGPFWRLATTLEEFVVRCYPGTSKTRRVPTADLLEALLEAGLSISTFGPDYVSEHLAQIDELTQAAKMDKLDRLRQFLRVLNLCAVWPDKFAVFVRDYRSETVLPNLQLHLACLDGGFLFQEVADSAHACILMSGSLWPWEPIEAELGWTMFGRNKLVTSHPIRPDQLRMAALTHFPNQQAANCTSGQLENPTVCGQIGHVLIHLASQRGGGMLVFFASYGAMNRVIEQMKSTAAAGQWSSLAAQKPVFVEPRDSVTFSQILVSYKAAVLHGHGGILLAAARGKCAEGLSMAGQYCATLVQVGIPFAALHDPVLRAKMDYCTAQSRGVDKQLQYAGAAYYQHEAYTILAQCLGRAIRHPGDHCAILLLDERFSRPKVIEKLPRTMRDELRVLQTLDQVDYHFQGVL